MNNKRLLRVSALILALLTTTALLTGCKPKAQSASTLDGLSAEQILDRIYETADLELPSLGTTKIDAENQAYYFGAADIDYTDAVASEPLMSSIAYSVCVLRLSDATKNAEAQKALKEGANPVKWICVGVDEQNVLTAGKGDVVVLIMAEQAQALKDAFEKIAG